MSEINDGGRAFPCEQGHCPDGTWNQSFEPGMSLRDYIAARTLQGFCANPAVFAANARTGWSLVNCSKLELAAFCYELADAMLAVRNEKGETVKEQTA